MSFEQAQIPIGASADDADELIPGAPPGILSNAANDIYSGSQGGLLRIGALRFVLPTELLPNATLLNATLRVNLSGTSGSPDLRLRGVGNPPAWTTSNYPSAQTETTAVVTWAPLGAGLVAIEVTTLLAELLPAITPGDAFGLTIRPNVVSGSNFAVFDAIERPGGTTADLIVSWQPATGGVGRRFPTARPLRRRAGSGFDGFP